MCSGMGNIICKGLEFTEAEQTQSRKRRFLKLKYFVEKNLMKDVAGGSEGVIDHFRNSEHYAPHSCNNNK